MEISLLICVLLTLLDILVFQQVYVNLVLDLDMLYQCQHNSAACDITNPGNSSTYYFLVMCSVFNVFIKLTHITFIYINRSRIKNGRHEELMMFGINFAIIRDIVRVWKIFLLIYSVIFILNFVQKQNNQESSSGSHFPTIFIAATGIVFTKRSNMSTLMF